MIVEGKNAVEEALGGHATVEKIMIQKGTNAQYLVDKIKDSGIVYQFVDRTALDRVSKTKNHQGFVAFVSDYRYFELREIIDEGYKKGTQPLILILDGVEDPHNFGNIIRTAECMGVDGIIIPKNRSASVTDTVIRVSAGAASHVKVCKVTNINHEIEYLKEKGFWIFAADMGGMDVSKTNLSGPIAIVMGGEHTGVRTLTRTLVDGIVSVPQHGKVNSLNVANATAMVLYEVNRQRGAK
ncbi:MAG: 23S rRNA (guanosine(2251)-2'-O)-methyltransferase RlmB [Firmicutes bacterium]|nr:23S rRNA (guanosine(2251)-2'-O)-methyltransferase RlmB [Bacillota bacterium]